MLDYYVPEKLQQLLHLLPSMVVTIPNYRNISVLSILAKTTSQQLTIKKENNIAI